MNTKLSTTRIEETLAYLQNLGPALYYNVADRNEAFLFAQAYANTFRRSVFNSQFRQFSNNLSFGLSRTPEVNDSRKIARTLHLLWSAFAAQPGGFRSIDSVAGIPADPSALDGGMAPRFLRATLRKARILRQRAVGNTAALQDMLANVLPGNPLQVLGESLFIVYGSGAGPPIPAIPTNVRNFHFSYDKTHDRYKFDLIPSAGSIPVQAESVVATFWTRALTLVQRTQIEMGLNDINHAVFNRIPRVRLSGANMMVTTQFTGCSFCMMPHGGHVYCAHLTPMTGRAEDHPNTDGATLSQQVVATGAFEGIGGGAHFRVFGRMHGTPPNAAGYNLGAGGGGGVTWMTILGFPHAGAYNIYSQTIVNRHISATVQIL